MSCGQRGSGLIFASNASSAHAKAILGAKRSPRTFSDPKLEQQATELSLREKLITVQ